MSRIRHQKGFWNEIYLSSLENDKNTSKRLFVIFMPGMYVSSVMSVRPILVQMKNTILKFYNCL